MARAIHRSGAEIIARREQPLIVAATLIAMMTMVTSNVDDQP
jgi:hypothetical protein